MKRSTKDLSKAGRSFSFESSKPLAHKNGVNIAFHYGAGKEGKETVIERHPAPGERPVLTLLVESDT